MSRIAYMCSSYAISCFYWEYWFLASLKKRLLMKVQNNTLIARNGSNGENSEKSPIFIHQWTWVSQLIKGVVTFVGKLHVKKRLWFYTLNTTNSHLVNTHYHGHSVHINWIPWKTNKRLPETKLLLLWNLCYYGLQTSFWVSTAWFQSFNSCYSFSLE